MRTLLKVTIGIVLCFSVGLQAQNNKIKIYKVWLTLVDGSTVRGDFYSANIEGIKIRDNSLDISKLTLTKPQNIQILKIRRRGKIGKGVWVGVVSGLALGGLIGLIDGDDEPGFLIMTAEEKAVSLGIAFAFVGSGVGPLIASGRKKIVINGDLKNYEKQLEVLQNYSLEMEKTD